MASAERIEGDGEDCSEEERVAVDDEEEQEEGADDDDADEGEEDDAATDSGEEEVEGENGPEVEDDDCGDGSGAEQSEGEEEEEDAAAADPPTAVHSETGRGGEEQQVPAAEQIEEDEEEEADDEPADDAADDDDEEEEGDKDSPSASSSSDDDSEDEYREEEGEESDEDDDEELTRARGNGERKEAEGMLEAVEKIGVKKGAGWSRPLQQPSSGRKCEICSKEFKWPTLLRQHLQTHVNECPDCGINCLSYQALRTHIAKEHKERIQCPKCDYAHKAPSQVRRHFEQNHVQGLACPIGGCSAVVAFNRLRTHIAKVHAAAAAAAQRKGALPVRPSAVAAGSRDSVGGGSIECEECGRVVESERELEMHVQSAHGAGVFCPHPECRGASGAERMQLHELQSHIEERHAEDARLPHFHTQSGRSISIASDTTFSEYAVSRSSHPTTTASSAVGPTSSSVPSCPSTSRGPRTRSVIYSTDPIEEEEEEENPEAPSTSDGRSSRATRSASRKRKGAEEEKGGMKQRKKGRIEEDDLDDDIRELEEQQRGERKRGAEVPAFSELGLVCKECGKVYANTDSLRKHKARVHEKRYAEKAVRAKQYACTKEGCDKAFTSPGALQDHINKHNGVVAHVCDHCEKSFISRAYYARHLSKYHQISIKSLDGFQEFVAAAKGKKAKKEEGH